MGTAEQPGYKGVVPGKCVVKLKRNEIGIVAKYEARFVAKLST